MRRLNIYILLVVILGGVLGFIFPNESTAKIDRVIGNTSYEEISGGEVTTNLKEQDRIRIHLAYVEYSLRKKGTEHLTETQEKNRENALDLLHEYWVAGKFPSNMDYPNERKPCFKDRNGNICAVGYLVDETGNSGLVDDIQCKQNYDYIFDIESDELAQWVAESGLSLNECAMIQPTYGFNPSPNPDYVQPAYAISSVALSGIGLASSYLSMKQTNLTGKGSWIIPAVGMASGISQITLGSIYYRRSNNQYSYCWDFNCTPFYKRSQNLSLLNIGFGTLTTAISTFSFIRQLKHKKKHEDLSWNIYGYQLPTEEYTVGINLVKRF